MDDPRVESPHPKVLRNENPAFFGDLFGNAMWFLESYGWYLVIGLVILFYLKSKFSPKLNQMKSQWNRSTEMSASARAKKDLESSVPQGVPFTGAEQLWERQQAVDTQRRKLQEQHDTQAAKFAEHQRQKIEEKRQQQIDDWDRHQEGKGYRSKYRPPEDSQPSTSTRPNGAKKNVYRDQGYNPLMGQTGHASFRPPTRRTGGG